MKLNFQRDIILDCLCAWIGCDRVYAIRKYNEYWVPFYWETGRESDYQAGNSCHFLNEATQICEDHFTRSLIEKFTSFIL